MIKRRANRKGIIQGIKACKVQPDDNGSEALPSKKAFIYPRMLSQEQVGERRALISEIAELVVLAKNDGYGTSLDRGRLQQWLECIGHGEQGNQVIEDGDVVVDCSDMGLCGSLDKDRRPGLAHLHQRVEGGEIDTVYTQDRSRLSRDELLCNKLLRLFKERQCRLKTQD